MGSGGQGGAEGKEENEAGSAPGEEPADPWLHLATLSSRAEPKPRVKRLTDCITHAPPKI